MPLINFEINLILTWSEDCVISSATGETKFKITNTKLYVPIVILSTLFYHDFLFYCLKMRAIEKYTQDIILQK